MIDAFSLNAQPEEVFDTVYVCDPADTGQMEEVTTIDNCTAILKTVFLLRETPGVGLVTEIPPFCEQVDRIDLVGELPIGATGIWTNIDLGASIANDAEPITTTARLNRQGIHTFVWTLSTPDCPDYAADTLVVSTPEFITAADDVYKPSKMGNN